MESNKSISASRLCKNVFFQNFMKQERKPLFKDAEYNAVNALYFICGIRDLNELQTNEKAATIYDILIKKFQESEFGKRYAEMIK